MSARKRANCASLPAELVLGYQSKRPSKQLNFTPTCDSCDCGFPVHGPLLVSAYLWQLEPSLSPCLPLCLTLCLCTSLSLFHSAPFLYLPRLLWMAKWPVAHTSHTHTHKHTCRWLHPCLSGTVSLWKEPQDLSWGRTIWQENNVKIYLIAITNHKLH